MRLVILERVPLCQRMQSVRMHDHMVGALAVPSGVVHDKLLQQLAAVAHQLRYHVQKW